MSLFPQTIFGGTYGYGWGIPTAQPTDVPADLDAKAKPEDGLLRTSGYGGQNFGMGYDDAPPPSLELYWRMRQYSAIALAFQALAGPIFAGSRTLEIMRRDGEAATPKEQSGPATGDRVIDSPEDKVKRAAERHFSGLWPDILTGIESLNFGFWLQEVRWEKRDGMVFPVEFADFELDEFLGQRVRMLENNRRFAGIEYDGKRLENQYVLHNVCNSHLDRLRGIPRSMFAREPWWRVQESERNGDRLQRKASGINLLLHVWRGQRFTDANNNPISSDVALAPLVNALSGGGVGTCERSMFNIDNIKINPALADISPVKVDQFNWGSTGADIMAQIARCDAQDKRIIRAYGLPERALTEATSGGSRADSETHGEGVADASEGVHSELLRQFNNQTFNTFLVTNKGPDWKGRLFWRAGQSTTADKAYKQGVWQALATTPGDPANGMTDRKRLAAEIEMPIDANYVPPQPQDQNQGQDQGGDPFGGLSPEERKVAESM